jgi:Fe-S-cluster containining protein
VDDNTSLVEGQAADWRPDCKGCGFCCTHMGSPPFVADSFEPDTRLPLFSFPPSMPEQLQREHIAYLMAVNNDSTVDRGGLELPCRWFDIDTRQCRNYEFRPEICRDYRCTREEFKRHRRHAVEAGVIQMEGQP